MKHYFMYYFFPFLKCLNNLLLNMKKFTIFIFSFIYLFLSIGVTITTHLCSGVVHSSRLAIALDNIECDCHSSCCETKKCVEECDNEILTIKISDFQVHSNKVKIEKESVILRTIDSTLLNAIPTLVLFKDYYFVDSSPPDLYLFNSSLLI